MSDAKKYLWHLSNERWEAAMETINDDAPPKSFKAVHEKVLRERGHKKGGKLHKKNGKIDSKRQEE